MVKFYKALSFILSPPMISFYVIIALSIFSPRGLGNVDTFSSILIGTIFMVLVPFGSIYYLSREDLDILKKEKRIIPYLITITSYLTSSMIFWILQSQTMFVISVTYVCVASAAFIINIFWKISAHTAGIAGPTTALIYVFGFNFIPLYALTLLTFWIRFKMKVHNILQLIAGIIVSIFITSIVYTILW